MRRLFNAIANLVRGDRADRDLDRELRMYLDHAVEHHRQRGLNREDAERAAHLEFGGLDQVKESVRAVPAGVWVETCWRDLAYAARALRKNPGFAVAAVLTIALGIGVNTTSFSLLNGLTYHHLPVPDAGRVVSLSQTFTGEMKRNVHGMASLFSSRNMRPIAIAINRCQACSRTRRS